MSKTKQYTLNDLTKQSAGILAEAERQGGASREDKIAQTVGVTVESAAALVFAAHKGDLGTVRKAVSDTLYGLSGVAAVLDLDLNQIADQTYRDNEQKLQALREFEAMAAMLLGLVQAEQEAIESEPTAGILGL